MKAVVAGIGFSIALFNWVNDIGSPLEHGVLLALSLTLFVFDVLDTLKKEAHERRPKS